MPKTLRHVLATVVLMALSAPALQAACLDPAESFSCTTTRGKLVEVCAGTEGFIYSYGNDEPAEMELYTDFADAEVTPWPGIGQDIWSSITFRNGDHAYEVHLSAPRGGAGALSGGVTVRRGDTDIARLACDAAGPAAASPEIFSEVMEARGFCWNGRAGLWQMAGSC